MRHPANIAHHEERSRGERAADAVAAFLGSWGFIICQTVLVAGWIALNALAWRWRWDPYPFILLNLAFSTQAAYAAPILQLAQNRQTQHDRLRAEADYQINAEALTILRENARMLAEHKDMLAALAVIQDLMEQHHVALRRYLRGDLDQARARPGGDPAGDP